VNYKNEKHARFCFFLIAYLWFILLRRLLLPCIKTPILNLSVFQFILVKVKVKEVYSC